MGEENKKKRTLDQLYAHIMNMHPPEGGEEKDDDEIDLYKTDDDKDDDGQNITSPPQYYSSALSPPPPPLEIDDYDEPPSRKKLKESEDVLSRMSKMLHMIRKPSDTDRNHKLRLWNTFDAFLYGQNTDHRNLPVLTQVRFLSMCRSP